MEQNTPEATPRAKVKKRLGAGTIILLVILGIIILVPLLAYGYLALMGFDAAAQRCESDPAAAYAGETAYLPNGDARFTLEEGDIYWLLDEFELEKQLEAQLGIIDVNAVAARITEGGFTAYADGKALGFLPLSLKAICEAELTAASEITLNVKELWLGKWIRLPLGKLNLNEPFVLTLDGDEGAITALTLEADCATVTKRFLSEHIQKPENALSTLACDICLYADGGTSGDALVDACRDRLNTTAEQLYSAVAAQPDQQKAILDFLALCSTDTIFRMYQGLEEYEKHFILPFTEQAVEARRAEYTDMLIAGQRHYQTLLSAARTKYSSIELTLDVKDLLDNATGERVLVSSLMEDAGVSDEESRVILLFSYDALSSVMTHDMPQLGDVPRTGKKALRDFYPDMTYDIGLVLRMPNGMNCLIYYLAKNVFIILELPQEEFTQLLSAKELPILNPDSLSRAPAHTQWRAPADDLYDYVVYRLEDIVGYQE